MLGYVTIGALDIERSGRFYDAVFAALGGERKSSEAGFISYGPRDGGGTVYVGLPFDKQPARPGNGIMVAFRGASIAEVDAAHKAGLANGGTDEGAPGRRPAYSPSWYGGYLRDPTGNKICIHCRT
jgi:catechol 2,3-dioxygenase-like lactoylglutathione lyase family enzyme